jgi:hypothetical protein
MTRSADHRSPFTPGYGRPPLVFGGHGDIFQDIEDIFTTFDFGDSQSLLISGLRGAGKTSMLGLLRRRAVDAGWFVIPDDASTGLLKRVTGSIIPLLLDGLNEGERLRFTGFGVGPISAKWEKTATRPPAEPLLRHQLVALAAARDNAGILITIDEVSSGKVRLKELSRLALEIQHAIGDGANILVAFAGVKVDLNELVKQQHLTFLRRSREVDFRLLSPSETRHVLAETIRIGGRAIDHDALDALISLSQGYPYLIQLAGYYAWRHNPESPAITLDDARHSHDVAIRVVTSRVISRVWDDLSDRDQQFLRALAGGGGRRKVAEIVKRMGESDQYVQVYKRRLIDSGYVQSDGHGYVTFSLPYLDQYINSLDSDIDDAAKVNDGAETWKNYPPPRI